MTTDVSSQAAYALLLSEDLAVSSQSVYALQTVEKLAVVTQTAYVVMFSEKMNVARQTAYVALFSGDRANVSRQTAYVVLTTTGGSITVSGQTVYVVFLRPPSNLYQDDNLIRPNYENTPIDNIVFDVGESLKINIVYPGTFTLILLRPDLSFLETEVVLVVGVNTLSLTDFNQLAIVRGSPPEILKNSIKQTMLTRI